MLRETNPTGLFQSAPRVLTRGDLPILGRRSLFPVQASFNPRPVFSHGATRPTGEARALRGSAFQSAPRVLTRGDPRVHRISPWRPPWRFQSAPRVLTRGDIVRKACSKPPAT